MRTSPPSHFSCRVSGPSCKGSKSAWPSSLDPRRRGWKGSLALIALALLVGNIYAADIAVNCGGGNATPFGTDANFVGGEAKTTYSAVDVSAVSNPAPQNVYLTNRHVISGAETQFSYSFPGLTVGSSYLVRLHFAETSSNGPGIRVFNVAINGTQVLSNFDIYASAGGKNKAIIKEFTVAPDSTGKVTIQFSNISNLAQCNGIEITYVPQALTKINCGGTSATPFSGDSNFSGGEAKTTYSGVDVSSVNNPAPQGVYLTNRHSISGVETQFGYTLPGFTLAANYLIRLHFAETSSNGPGIRVFNVAINGTQVLSSFDIYASAGGKNKAIVKEFVLPPDSTGKFTIIFSNISNLAQCNGIEIIPSTLICPWTPDPLLSNPERRQRLYNIARNYCEARFNASTNWVTSHSPPRGGGAVRESAYYAYGLLMTGNATDRITANAILRNVVSTQDTRVGSPSRGAFLWDSSYTWETYTNPDLNSAAFVGAVLADVTALDRRTPVLDADVRTLVNQAGALAVQEIMTRNVDPGYSNIALLSTGVAAAGQTLWNVGGAGSWAESKLDAVISLAGTGAIYEYLAPTYYGVDLLGAYYAQKYAISTTFGQKATNMISHLWNEVGLSYHAPTAQLGGPCNRSYGENMLTYCAGLKYWIYLGKNDGYPIADSETVQAWDQASLMSVAEMPVNIRSEFSQPLPTDVLRQFTAVGPNDGGHPTRNISQYRSSMGSILGTVAYQDLWPQKRNLVAYWSLDAAPPTAGKIVGMCLDESNETLSGNLPSGTSYANIHFYSQQIGTNALVALACKPVNCPTGTAASRLVFGSGAVDTTGASSPITIAHGPWTTYIYPISLSSSGVYTTQTASGTGNLLVERPWTSSDAIGQARVLAYLVALRPANEPAPVVSGMSLSTANGLTTAAITVDGTPMSVTFAY